MRKFILSIGFLIIALLGTARARASDLEATLDRYEITAPMDAPTVLAVTLRNNGAAPLYVTGVKVSLSEGASGDVYNPALVHDSLRKLGAGQTWDGPLIVIKPNHRGPLFVKGAIRLAGGLTADAVEPLVSIPLQFTIDDPRRNRDGSYDRASVPACDRSTENCCDPSEANCFQMGDRCWYVAEGYDRQQLCANHQAGKNYEHIANVRVSTDGAHVTYSASFQCHSDTRQEHCQNTLVSDGVEKP